MPTQLIKLNAAAVKVFWFCDNFGSFIRVTFTCVSFALIHHIRQNISSSLLREIYHKNTAENIVVCDHDCRVGFYLSHLSDLLSFCRHSLRKIKPQSFLLLLQLQVVLILLEKTIKQEHRKKGKRTFVNDF